MNPSPFPLADSCFLDFVNIRILKFSVTYGIVNLNSVIIGSFAHLLEIDEFFPIASSWEIGLARRKCEGMHLYIIEYTQHLLCDGNINYGHLKLTT